MVPPPIYESWGYVANYVIFPTERFNENHNLTITYTESNLSFLSTVNVAK